MVLLELQQEPGVSSEVTTGMALKNSCFFSNVRTPVQLGGTPRDSPRGLAGQ